MKSSIFLAEISVPPTLFSFQIRPNKAYKGPKSALDILKLWNLNISIVPEISVPITFFTIFSFPFLRLSESVKTSNKQVFECIFLSKSAHREVVLNFINKTRRFLCFLWSCGASHSELTQPWNWLLSFKDTLFPFRNCILQNMYNFLLINHEDIISGGFFSSFFTA